MSHQPRSFCAALLAAVFLTSCGSTWPTEAARNRDLMVESYYSRVSDYQMLEMLKLANGEVFIGFKEAEDLRRTRLGPAPTPSDSTLDYVKRFLRSQGVKIEAEYSIIPAVSATMSPNLRLLVAVRYHPNVEYVEPIRP